MSRLKTLVVSVSTVLVALLLVGAVLGKSADDEGAYRQLAVYTEVLSRIKSDYVEEPDLKSVTLGALNGLLESIDPYASYLSAEQYKEYVRNKDRYKGSVGLVLSKRFGAVGVVDAVPGSAADKAGLATGDLIESIKGVATRDMPLAYAEMLLYGEPGSTVEISLISIRNPEPKKVTLTRSVVQYPQVSSRLLPDGVGHIAVQALRHGTAKDIASAVKDLEKQGARQLVLDVRHCATGEPEEGVTVANLFLDKGTITYLKGQKVQRQTWEADPAKSITRLPVVVLTNRGTAGGAEIVAAALQDNKRAEIVGERTYGAASLRQAISMDEPDGGAIILSVAKYYSPSGKAIQDNGVTPGVQVAETDAPVDLDDQDEDSPQAQPEQPSKPEDDLLLKRAVEVLKGTRTAQAPRSDSPAPGANAPLTDQILTPVQPR